MSATTDTFVQSNQERFLAELKEFLRIPSISTLPEHRPDIDRAAQFVADSLRNVGMENIEIIPTAGHPLVYADWLHAPGKPTVLCYGHYDVQPADPLEEWKSPPFEPTVRDGNIYGRGTADDKGQMYMHIKAIETLRAVNESLPINVKFLVEGEEEVGGAAIARYVEENPAKLKADVALVSDTEMYAPGMPTLCTGLRGLIYMEVESIGPMRDLHSGLFGGAAQNPIRVLAKVLAAIHDQNGRIAIPGFYDGVHELPADIRAELAALDLTPAEFLGQVGLKIPAGEKDRMLIEQISTRPTCDVNGIIGGYTGEGAKTVIPASASSKVSFRLVGDQDPEKISQAFRAFVRERLPADCAVEFSNFTSAPAIRLAYDNPALTKARAALAAEWGKKAVAIGSGGSIPIVGEFRDVLGMDSLLVGFALDDDRVHSPNEKYDLTSFHKGTRSWARILAELAGA
jgi:acetylornithine deacetylase/succinyl-diaminopimelate desuccinylase-like protein